MQYIGFLLPGRSKKSETKISYIKKNYSPRGIISSVLFIFSVAALISAVWLTYVRLQADMVAGALGICSILISLTGLGYGIGAFFEEDRNYLFARLGVFLHLILLVGIVLMVVFS